MRLHAPKPDIPPRPSPTPPPGLPCPILTVPLAPTPSTLPLMPTSTPIDDELYQGPLPFMSWSRQSDRSCAVLACAIEFRHACEMFVIHPHTGSVSYSPLAHTAGAHTCASQNPTPLGSVAGTTFWQ